MENIYFVFVLLCIVFSGTTAGPLNTGVMAVSITTSSVVSFLVGSLFGAVAYHCFTKKTSKPANATEVPREIKMKGNVAYEQHHM